MKSDFSNKITIYLQKDGLLILGTRPAHCYHTSSALRFLLHFLVEVSAQMCLFSHSYTRRLKDHDPINEFKETVFSCRYVRVSL